MTKSFTINAPEYQEEQKKFYVYNVANDEAIINAASIKKATFSFHLTSDNLVLLNESSENKINYVYQFDESFCNDFIDWIYLDRESSPRTRNNYRGWLYGLAEFFLQRKYIKENPVEHIKIMAQHDKYRKDLTPGMLKQMM